MVSSVSIRRLRRLYVDNPEGGGSVPACG